jgi:hypothetical protein
MARVLHCLAQDVPNWDRQNAKALTMVVQDTLTTPETNTQILHPGSRKLFVHWEAARAERAYPTREEFTLTPIRELMSDMVIIEKDYLRQSYRFRLVGTRVCTLFGRNITGGNVLDGWGGFESDVIAKHLDLALREHQPVLVRMRFITDTRQQLAAELIALPIQVRESNRVQLIGGLFPFRDPKTVGHAAVVARELVSARAIWTEHGARSRRPLPIAPERVERPVTRSLRVISGGRG